MGTRIRHVLDRGLYPVDSSVVLGALEYDVLRLDRHRDARTSAQRVGQPGRRDGDGSPAVKLDAHLRSARRAPDGPPKHVRSSDELGRLDVARIVVDLPWRSALDDLAGAH